jgi:hypothetical protein
MAYSQVDPARLEGEALRRWYLRSPAEIEEERQAAAAQAYENFFSGTRRLAGAAFKEASNDAEPIGFGGVGRRSGAEDIRSPAQRPPQNSAFTSDADGQLSGRIQLAANSGSGARKPTGSGDCLSCHGRAPPVAPLPPPFGTFPLPPAIIPFLRDGSGGSGRGSGGERSDGKNPKQCAVQYENDAFICNGINSTDARRRCWESAAKREAYCIKSKGEVGYPPLTTR